MRDAVLRELQARDVFLVRELVPFALNAGRAPDFAGSAVLSTAFSEELLGAAAVAYRERLKLWGKSFLKPSRWRTAP